MEVRGKRDKGKWKIRHDSAEIESHPYVSCAESPIVVERIEEISLPVGVASASTTLSPVCCRDKNVDFRIACVGLEGIQMGVVRKSAADEFKRWNF